MEKVFLVRSLSHQFTNSFVLHWALVKMKAPSWPESPQNCAWTHACMYMHASFIGVLIYTLSHGCTGTYHFIENTKHGELVKPHPGSVLNKPTEWETPNNTRQNMKLLFLILAKERKETGGNWQARKALTDRDWSPCTNFIQSPLHKESGNYFTLTEQLVIYIFKDYLILFKTYSCYGWKLLSVQWLTWACSLP